MRKFKESNYYFPICFIPLTNDVFTRWAYLEPIFGSGTLGHERNRFERLDRDFRHVMKFIGNDPRVGALCRYVNLKSVLENILDQLSRCQNSLDNFLTVRITQIFHLSLNKVKIFQEKRNKFPRFLFIGDDDLLEIVGQSSKEQVIQTHLKKLFAGIHSIQLDESRKFINAICSSEGEIVSLIKSVDINHPVEVDLI